RGKWSVAELAAFLVDPSVYRAGARMPAFGLNDVEARALASFLLEHWNSKEATAGQPTRVILEPGAIGPDPTLVAAGARGFAEPGCFSCHSLSQKSAAILPAPALVDLVLRATKAPTATSAIDASSLRGCLAANDAARGRAPKYAIADEQRAEL